MEITDPDMKARLEDVQSIVDDAGPDVDSALLADAKSVLELYAKVTLGMPSEIAMKFKGKLFLTEMHGGMMDNQDILFLADENETYVINHSDETYSLLPIPISAPAPKLKIQKTSDTAKLLGYSCTRYIIEKPDRRGNIIAISYWATTEITGIDLKALANQTSNSDQAFIYSEIEGFPLKVETPIKIGSFVAVVTKIRKTSLSDSDFEIPSGYKETGF